jgi:hypothetical protein
MRRLSLLLAPLLALILLWPGAAEAIARPAGYKLRWSDEFSKFDATKWRCQGQVAISKGALRLTASGTSPTHRKSGGCRSADNAYLNSWGVKATRKGESYKGPTVQSEGWLEIRMMAAPVRGVMSEIPLYSDWLQIPADSADRWVAEIDMPEVKGHKPYEAWVSTHARRWPNWTAPPIDSLQNNTAPITTQRYATYVLHWSVLGAPTDFLRVYVNGYLRHTRDLSRAPWQVFAFPFSITMSCWVVANSGWGGEQGVDWARLPTSMYVDWVRFYTP